MTSYLASFTLYLSHWAECLTSITPQLVVQALTHTINGTEIGQAEQLAQVTH
jgi:hypothetical protein